MNDSRAFVLRSKSIVQVACNAINNLPIDDKEPFEIVLRRYKEKRKLQQNALMWIRLGEIAEQAFLDGKKYNAETWHEYCKRQYLPETIQKCISKWIVLPKGERALNMSTGDLNTKEFANYMTQIEHFGCDLGVMFGANPNEHQFF